MEFVFFFFGIRHAYIVTNVYILKCFMEIKLFLTIKKYGGVSS